MRTARQIADRVKALRIKSAPRDAAFKNLIAIRKGDYETVMPGLFGDAEFDRPMVANLVDTVARDIAEVMAPLPSVNCPPASLSNDADQKRQDIRSAIANSYIQNSRLQTQRYSGTDRYGSFGFMAYSVEPDFDEKMPTIRIRSVPTANYTMDYRGRVKEYFEVYKVSVEQLKADYPESAPILENKFKYSAEKDKWVEVAWYADDHCWSLVLIDPCLTLVYAPNRTGRCCIRIVGRPDILNDPRGQFDDVIWVQVARAITQSQTFEALDKAINAPIAVPRDVDQIDIGPMTVIQSEQPQNIGRVPLNLPSGIFPEGQILAQEQRTGSRYPEGRSGNIDASIVTGQGVQALMGTFDTQIQTFHTLDSEALEDVLEFCFRMDEAYWGGEKKIRRIKDNGAPRKFEYIPLKDINGDYTVDASYGAIAGLDPNRALVFILQALAGGLISTQTARKYLPVDLNTLAEERQIQIEQVDAAVAAALAQLPLAIPQMAMMGQDPREATLQLAKVRELLSKGKSPVEAIEAAFAPKEKEAVPPVDPMQAAMEQAAAGAPAALPGQGQGGASDLLMNLVGTSPSGNSQMGSLVSRRKEI